MTIDEGIIRSGHAITPSPTIIVVNKLFSEMHRNKQRNEYFKILDYKASDFEQEVSADLFTRELIKNPPQFSNIRCKNNISIKNNYL